MATSEALDQNRADIADRLTAALTQIDEWVSPTGVPSVGAAICHRGEIVAERYVGEARPGQPVRPDTLFGLASVTKPITAATVMTLVEDGRIALDDRVTTYVPEFAAADPGAGLPIDPDREAQRAEITVRQLLCHVSGLPEDLGPRHGRFAAAPTLADLTDALVRLPLQSKPGKVLRYSNAGYATLARLAERAGGEEFWQMTRRWVLAPLGIETEIVARPGERESGRIAHLVDAAGAGTPTESYNSRYWRELAIPWGGLYGTPRALARYTASFLPAYDRRRALTPVTTAEMVRDHAGGIPGGVESGKVWWDAARWGLGWEVKGEKSRHWTGERTSAATFCHFGQAGTLVWADPACNLALAVFAGRAVSRRWGFFLTRWTRLSDALVAVVAP